MTALTFYESNALRSYPLHHSYAPLHKRMLPSFIVDAGFIVYKSTTEDSTPSIISHPEVRIKYMYLYNPSTVRIVIDAPTLTGVKAQVDIPFSLKLQSDKYLRYRLDQESTDIPWHIDGYIVTGGFFELTNDIFTVPKPPPTGFVFCTDLPFEPTTIQVMQQQRIGSISIANDPRSTVLNQQLWGSTQKTNTQVVQQGLTGDVKLIEGYNCLVRTQEDNNAINLHAFLGAGKGLPCEFWEPDTSEEKCDELIFTVNGVKAVNGNLEVVGKPPVSVLATEDNSVYVRLGDGKSKLVCQNGTS